MKKYIFIFLGFALSLNAQIHLGGQPETIGSSTILQFHGNTASQDPKDPETNNELGIILPAVESLPDYSNNGMDSNPNNGTFIYDFVAKKVKMYQNGAWMDISIREGDNSQIILNPSEEIGNGAIIGSTSSDAKGVLVIESENKAMILPHIKNPHLTVKSPYPGMMCYDTQSNSLSVFDGINWNYWK